MGVFSRIFEKLAHLVQIKNAQRRTFFLAETNILACRGNGRARASTDGCRGSQGNSAGYRPQRGEPAGALDSLGRRFGQAEVSAQRFNGSVRLLA